MIFEHLKVNSMTTRRCRCRSTNPRKVCDLTARK